MRIIIDIPEQFESDYKGDMFKDFFSRVLCDIPKGTICGNYEKETAEMFLKAFDESIPMDRIVEQLEEAKSEDVRTAYCQSQNFKKPCGNRDCFECYVGHLVEIVKAGGKDGK